MNQMNQMGHDLEVWANIRNIDLERLEWLEHDDGSWQCISMQEGSKTEVADLEEYVWEDMGEGTCSVATHHRGDFG